jgi:hypothetical protein
VQNWPKNKDQPARVAQALWWQQICNLIIIQSLNTPINPT